MTSIVPQRIRNSFRKDLLDGRQDSGVFLLVPKGGSILSTLYHAEVWVGEYVRELISQYLVLE